MQIILICIGCLIWISKLSASLKEIVEILRGALHTILILPWTGKRCKHISSRIKLATKELHGHALSVQEARWRLLKTLELTKTKMNLCEILTNEPEIRDTWMKQEILHTIGYARKMCEYDWTDYKFSPTESDIMTRVSKKCKTLSSEENGALKGSVKKYTANKIETPFVAPLP